MPKVQEDDTPEGLKVFAFHHVPNLSWTSGDDDAYADCPFCGTSKKLGINKTSGLFNCFVCGAKGNGYSFVRMLHEQALADTPPQKYEKLAQDSQFLSGEAAREWGVAIHPLTDEWCLPGYNHETKVTGLYRFAPLKKKDGSWGRKLLPSPGLGHHLFGLNLYEEQKPHVYLTEGWRDGIVLYEVLRDYAPHGVPLLNEANVLAVPGTNSFKPEWAKFFRKKNVWIMYDNDHPKVNPKTGESVLVGGTMGVRRVASILRSLPQEDQPEVVGYLAWGSNENVGYTTELENGTDLRDFISNA
jgi:hypothetical protein